MVKAITSNTFRDHSIRVNRNLLFKHVFTKGNQLVQHEKENKKVDYQSASKQINPFQTLDIGEKHQQALGITWSES